MLQFKGEVKMTKVIEYNKLVRDNIPNIINETGNEYIIHIADEDEYKGKLLDKLKEETIEFLENPCEEEIADILEVIDGLINHYKFSIINIQDIKYKKSKVRGKFEKKIILERVINP